jgi:DTW domain-containing protein
MTDRCIRCSRPTAQCVCEHLQPVSTRTSITILQHPGERHHAFNTARLAREVLADCRVVLAWADRDGRLHVPLDLPPKTALLFPTANATAIDPLDPPEHLVVLDGTWSHVKRLIADNPWCADLPAVSLTPAEPSTYRIREEPALHCVSTIEAIALALREIEPETEGLDRVLAGFTAMVDGHLAQNQMAQTRRRQRSRPTLPERLRDRAGAIAVYAEALGLRDGSRPRLLQWTAVRLDDGVCFDGVVRPEEGVSDEVLDALGLDLAGAEPLDALRARWRAFLAESGDEALGFSWSGQTRRVAEASGLGLRVHSLKSIAGQQGIHGHLMPLMRAQGWTSQDCPVRGRASERLGNAVAVAHGLAAST